jgi:hypothetical protein
MYEIRKQITVETIIAIVAYIKLLSKYLYVPKKQIAGSMDKKNFMNH